MVIRGRGGSLLESSIIKWLFKKKVLFLTRMELEKKFGRCITDLELAKYFQIDVRTLRKYAAELGGVMILPGKYRFFENLLRERIKDAQFNQKKWGAALSGQYPHSREEESAETETVSGRQHQVVSGSIGMGEQGPDSAGRKPSPHGVY